MEGNEVHQIYNFDETTMDLTLKYFSIINSTNQIMKKIQPIHNYLGFLINTKYSLFDSCQWKLSDKDDKLGTQIKELISSIIFRNSTSKVCNTDAQIYGFNSHLFKLGDENSFLGFERDSEELFHKKMLYACKINYCDLVSNLSLFYNEFIKYLATALKDRTKETIFLKLVVVTGYNDKAINPDLFKSVLKTFLSDNIVLDLIFLLYENDYYTSNYVLTDEEIKPYINPLNLVRPGKKQLEELIGEFGEESTDKLIQSYSFRINTIANEIFENTTVKEYLKSFDLKLTNLKDMNEEVNGFIQNYNSKREQYHLEKLKTIIESKPNAPSYLERVVESIKKHIDSEKSKVNALVVDGERKLRDVKESLAEIRAGVENKYPKSHYWKHKLEFIFGMYEAINSYLVKIKKLDRFIFTVNEIILARAKKITS